MAEFKTLERLPKKQRDLIDYVSDERGNGDGIWIYLAKGYINTNLETHCIHEQTLTECLPQLRSSIKKCNCEECKAYWEKQNQ